jgi:hypothetical protein
MREDDKYSNPSSSSNIAYWSRDAWSRFIKDSIIPLHDHAQKLLNFYSYLCNFDNQPVNKVFKEWSGAEKALLGGVEFDENNYLAQYSERSLAKIYKELLGFSVNINAYFSYKIQGLEPNILCNVEEEKSIMPNVKNIHQLTSQIINLAIRSNLIEQHDSNANIDELIAKPESIVDELYRLFFERCMPITVGYNDYMNFVWSIRKITRKYLYALYPELKDKDKFEAIKEILGLKTLFKPKVGNEKLEEDYEVLGFYFSPKESIRPSSSLGELLCNLNYYIWKEWRSTSSIHDKLKLIAEPVPDLYNEYMLQVSRELDTKWKPLPIVKYMLDTISSVRRYPKYGEPVVHISGAVIEEIVIPYTYNYWFRKEYLSSTPLFHVLDNLMPAVSLGRYEIVFLSQDTFTIYIYEY